MKSLQKCRRGSNTAPSRFIKPRALLPTPRAPAQRVFSRLTAQCPVNQNKLLLNRSFSSSLSISPKTRPLQSLSSSRTPNRLACVHTKTITTKQDTQHNIQQRSFSQIRSQQVVRTGIKKSFANKTTQLFAKSPVANLTQKRSIGWTEWDSDLKDYKGHDVAIPIDHRDFDSITKRWEIRELLELRRHCNTTAAGRIYSYSCLVFVGNRKGSAGLGYGKGLDPAKATENAFRNACKNILSLRTPELNRPIYAKFVSSKVLLRPKSWGNMGGYMMDRLMSAFGLENVHLKTFGNRNRKNMYKAIFFGLARCIYVPSEQAKHMGKKFVDTRKIWLGRPEYNREKDLYEYLSKREDYH